MNRTRSISALTTTILVIGALTLFAGCSKDGNEWQRLVCEASSVNDGQVLVSAFQTAGPDKNPCNEDDTLPIDAVTVKFHARPYSDIMPLTDDEPYSYFHVTSYDVIWHPMSADGDSLVNYNMVGAGTDALVPVYGESELSVLVADRHMKDRPWFAALSACNGGSLPSFSAVAELRFHGHETGSDREIVVPASLTVTFVGITTQ